MVETAQRRHLLRKFLKLIRTSAIIAAITLGLILMMEVAIRIIYHVRNSMVEVIPIPNMIRNFRSAPPWMESLRLLEPNESLMLTGRPHAHLKYMDLYSPAPSEEARMTLLSRFRPGLPEWARASSIWEVWLNSDGFRDREFPIAKPSGVIRIICIGDSWTFGTNVNQDQAYPQRLTALLKEDFPQNGIEVFNMGILAYSSHEGLALLKQRVLGLHPDFVIIGYALNDSAIAGWRDKDQFPANPRPARFQLKAFLANHMESLKLLRYFAELSKFKQVSLTAHLKAIASPNDKFIYETWASAESLEASDYERFEPQTRVSPKDYETNMRRIIAVVQSAGATPILLHNELRPGSPYQAVLQKLSSEGGIPLIDSSALIAAARQHIERELEHKLNLAPPGVASSKSNGCEIVFRIDMGDNPVPEAIHIAGPHPQLGDAIPNRIRLYDDGTHGDQKVGDHVWSLATTFFPGQKVFYVYTNSGTDGKWENLDVPKIRSFTLPASGSGPLYRPIESFGQVYMQADSFHPNAAGYDLIARAVEAVLKQNDKFKMMLSSNK
jgi:lysophospholipase L1-like esterase